MKLQFCVILLGSTLVAFNVFAADDTKPAATVSGPAVAAPAPASAANEVVKMFAAGVKEDAILSYIANAPRMVLTADDVIFLHDHGVSTDCNHRDA
jgi:hypothetical protein